MGAIANLSLLDGQATPVAKVFTPTKASDDIAKWSDKSSGRYIGLPTVTISSRIPMPKSPLFKVNFEIVLPVLETITNANANGYSAPPQVAYEVKAVGTFICPDRSAVQERKDIAAFASNLFKDAQFLKLITDFESPY